MQTKVNYTWREKNIKQCTNLDIIKNARVILNEKGFAGIALCMNALHRELEEIHTIEKANEILSCIVDDSLFYSYNYL